MKMGNAYLFLKNFFNTKPQHKVSWRDPRSKHWHQLDLILTRCPALSSVKLTRSYQSADCDTDHSLVCSKVKLLPRRLHHSKKEGRLRFDTSKTRDQDRVKEFARALEDVLPGKLNSNASERWQHLRDAVRRYCHFHLWQEKKMSADWFEANAKVKMPVTEAKRHVLVVYKACTSQQNLQALQATRSKV